MLRILFAFLFLLSLSDAVHSQHPFTTRSIGKNKLPQSITYNYQFRNADTWEQHDTVHYVILSQTDMSPNASNTGRSAYVNAYHYIIVNDSAKLIWKVQDGITDCEVDYHANFIPGSFSVSDIDHDNVPEIWLMYSLACKGDVSPSELKIIMYEGSKKHAMRGRMLVIYSDQREGGEFNFDAAFKQAPVAIRNYAMAMWNKYREEKLN